MEAAAQHKDVRGLCSTGATKHKSKNSMAVTVTDISLRIRSSSGKIKRNSSGDEIRERAVCTTTSYT